MQPVSTTFVVTPIGSCAISATGICRVAAVAFSMRFVHAVGVSWAARYHFPSSCRTSTVNFALYPSGIPSPVRTVVTDSLGATSAFVFAAVAAASVSYSIGKPGVTNTDDASSPTWMYSCSRPSTARPIRKTPSSAGFLTKNSFFPVL